MYASFSFVFLTKVTDTFVHKIGSSIRSFTQKAINMSLMLDKKGLDNPIVDKVGSIIGKWHKTPDQEDALQVKETTAF